MRLRGRLALITVGIALVMASPGAATLTHEPLLLNEARCLLASLAPTAIKP